MNFIFKKTLNPADLFLLAVNLIPIWGVWFQGWDAKMIFIVYCLESVIAGLYTVIKLWLTALYSDGISTKEQAPFNKKSIGSAIFITVFFCFHYGFFIFVQLSIFLGIIGNINGKSVSVTKLVFQFNEYLPMYAQLFLLSFFISYGISLLKDFIVNKAYKKAEIQFVMMSPYKRIFIQQFLVILGSFALLLNSNGKIFIFIFAIIKIIADVFIDYEKILKKGLSEN
ncbi:MAG: hypothetical protein KF781_09350 [Chitinophagaceae bacterium]|nr:hypothetical protein [Chitinophagaceae bacterium]MCW5904979.1 hypothetical protein [Chitinophagaceae bacterium]